MARIFISVHPDNTFTSARYHGDPVAHAANQDCGVVTYMTDDIGLLEDFQDCFNRHIHGGGHFVNGDYIVGDWRQWGATCIRNWGAWFERVDCRARRNRTPTTSQKLRERVLKLIGDGEKSLGLIKNRSRGFDPAAVEACLESLVTEGLALRASRTCKINGMTFNHYRATQV